MKQSFSNNTTLDPVQYYTGVPNDKVKDCYMDELRNRYLTIYRTDGTEEIKYVSGNVTYQDLGKSSQSSKNDDISSVIVGSVVKYIANNSFSHLINLRNVLFKSNVISVGNGSFSYCSCLTYINLENVTDAIGAAAFYSTDDISLSSIKLNKNLSRIGRYAFFADKTNCLISADFTDFDDVPYIDEHLFGDDLNDNFRIYFDNTQILNRFKDTKLSTYQSRFISLHNNVSFVDGDTVIDTQNVYYNESASVPSYIPTRISADFIGWDDNYMNVSTDVSSYAQFQTRKYLVRFISDMSAVSKQTVEYGKSAVRPEDPVKEHYTFSGWDRDFSFISSDLNVNAVFTESDFVVRFFVDGEQYGETQYVGRGESAERPSDPVKTGYTFTGWDKDFTNVQCDLDINAIFEKRTYTVTLKSDPSSLGTTRGSGTYEYQDTAVLSAVPNIYCSFTGWSDGSTDNPHYITVESDIELSAFFVQQTGTAYFLHNY